MLYEAIKQQKNDQKLISLWLIICLILIVIIILVGGLTRLTNSGLSIVEWKPIIGIIPPLNNDTWQIEFDKYKEFAEYKHINYDMSLAEFKLIYYLEYIHRVIGRIITLVFFIPLFFFWHTGKFLNYHKCYNFIIALVLLAQGVMGWYMVKSGLYDIPHVSHYRLTIHLMLAIVIYSLLFMQLMENQGKTLLVYKPSKLYVVKILCIISLIFTYTQIILGGLLAGLKGGLLYNSFPLMGDYFVAYEIANSSWRELLYFDDPVWVQFLHRINAYILLVVITLLTYFIEKTGVNKLISLGRYIFLTMWIQFMLGLFTLLYSVPISLALLHQLGAVMLLTLLLHCIYYFIVDKTLSNIDR